MTPFHLTVLGPPELRAPNGDPIRFRTRKHLALLVYLAVERPIAHRRDKLATLLWPNSAMEEARHSLATGLSFLRARLGSGAFESNRDSVRLIPGRVSTDLLAFDAPKEDDDTDAPLPAMFLEEFELPGAPDFQLWCDAHRARYIPRLQSRLVRRIDQARRAGDPGRMDAYADQLRRIDHLSEDAVRGALEAKTMKGDRIGALKLFDNWRTSLATELGASPSRTLEQIALRLRRNSFALTSDQHVVSGSGLKNPAAPFVGRHREFATSRQQWERACSRTPAHILIHGEHGVGRSAFATRLVTALSLDGALASITRCYRTELTLELSVISELIDSISQHAGAIATPPEQLSILATFAPSLASRFPGLQPSTPRVTSGDMLPLVEALVSLLGAVTLENPVLLVIDDVQWMDQKSRSIVHHLIRRLQGYPVMVVLTLLDSYGPSGHQGFHWDGLPENFITRLRLAPLTKKEAEVMVAHLFEEASASDRAAFDLLLRSTAGIPLAITELVRDWRLSGRPDLTTAIYQMTRGACGSAVGSYSLAVEREIADLPEETIAVAHAAALLDTQLNDLSLYEHFGVSRTEATRALAQLSARRILIPAPSGLCFRNMIVKERCYATVPASICRELHDRVATALTAPEHDNLTLRSLEVARHLLKAGRPEEALPFLVSGGASSIRLGYPSFASLALSAGLDALPAGISQEVALTLSEARQEMGEWEGSLRVLDEAKVGFDPNHSGRVTLIRAINERFLGVLVGPRLEEATEGLLTIASNPTESLDLRVRAISGAAALISSSREKRHIARLGVAATELRATGLNEYQSIHLAHGFAWYLAQSIGPKAALPILLEGASAIDRTGTADSIATRLLLGAGVTLCQLGRYSDASPLLRRAHSIASNLGNSALVANAASGVALVEGRLGNHDNQIEFAREAIQATGAEEWGICILSAAYDQGLGLAFSGRSVEAESAMAEFDTRFDKRRPVWIQQAWKLCKADVLVLAGNERKALSVGRVGTSGELKKLHHDCFAGQYARWVAFSGIRTGTAAGALARLERQIDSLERHDAKDQAEILAAVALLERSMGMESNGKWAQARGKLEKLPQPTQMMIRRLGLTQASDTSGWGLGGIR